MSTSTHKNFFNKDFPLLFSFGHGGHCNLVHVVPSHKTSIYCPKSSVLLNYPRLYRNITRPSANNKIHTRASQINPISKQVGGKVEGTKKVICSQMDLF